MFDRIVHADWSTRERGRWVAEARRDGSGWRVAPPVPVGDLGVFRERLRDLARSAAVLAGFDFPIGLPLAYGVQTGFADFRAALAAFGTREGWRDVYTVVANPGDISIRRPFYPAGSGAGCQQASLVTGLGLASSADLLRACEGGGPGRKRASPLFWTVGAAQVGRAAIAGWRHVVSPALESGAALWPFDGPLATLARSGGLVLAETYPADAYAQVGAGFGPRDSKRRQADRRERAAAILRWAATAGVDLSDCRQALADGFGASASGQDAFDALLGALAMIPVVTGRRAAMPDGLPKARLAWEGWILGRPALGV